MPGGFKCCTRDDGSKYVHLCKCPWVYLYAEGTSKYAVLCGFSEYTGPGITPSDPAKRYRKKTYSFTRENYDSCCYYSPPDYIKKVYYDYTHTGSLFKVYDIADCSISNSVTPFQVDRSYAYTTYEFGCGDVVESGTNDVTYYWDDGPTESTVSATQATDDYNQTSYYNETCEGIDKKVIRNETWTLSDEDTENDALARADETSHTSKSSVWETRSGYYIDFTKKTTDYCLLCTDLMVGKAYNGEIPIQKREAIRGNYGSWTAEPAATFSFTATKSFEIVGGSLHASISDQDFIDNDFSLNPTVYGLAAGTSVLVPATALTHVQGWEYEVGDNPSGDNPYCELT